jgi:glycosyltransferase involved in cell wall biosynthesis
MAMPKISYAITVCNEHEELARLLSFLQYKICPEDEIVIQYDEEAVTIEVLDTINALGYAFPIGFSLNKDFATFKNNLRQYCKGDYIFQLDADEMPNEYLIENLSLLLQYNPVDLLWIPRINIVEGITSEHISRWRWAQNKLGWVNYPDYQGRVYRNTESVYWENKVHERIVGHATFAQLPAEEPWSMYHAKTIDRQERQNELYSQI